MARPRVLWLLAALAGAGCVGPGAAWEGRYEGVYECNGTWRISGDPYTEGPSPQTIAIMWDSSAGQPFIAGACSLYLDVRSESYAEPITSECARVSPSGDPITWTTIGGALNLTGDRLAYDLSSILRFTAPPEATIDVNCTFDGVRVE